MPICIIPHSLRQPRLDLPLPDLPYFHDHLTSSVSPSPFLSSITPHSFIPMSKLFFFSNPILHRHLAPPRTDSTAIWRRIRFLFFSHFSFFQSLSFHYFIISFFFIFFLVFFISVIFRIFVLHLTVFLFSVSLISFFFNKISVPFSLCAQLN